MNNREIGEVGYIGHPLTRIMEKMRIIIILGLICSTGCLHIDPPEKFLLVGPYNEAYLQDSINNPPYDYYVGNNIIIIDTSSEILFHDAKLMCGTGWKVTNPPLPVNFDRGPLLCFHSIGDFLIFFKNHTRTPRLVIMASDKDTIRNQNYFVLADSLKSLKGTFFIATRKVTPGESAAIRDSFIIDIDMSKPCGFERMTELKYQLHEQQGAFDHHINEFLELSKVRCQYYFDYQLIYQEVLFSLLASNPKGFVKGCESLDVVILQDIFRELRYPFMIEEYRIKAIRDEIEESPESKLSKEFLDNLDKGLKYVQ